MNETPYFTTVPSPIGTLTLTGLEGALSGLFVEHRPPVVGAKLDAAPFRDVLDRLDRYWAGEITSFDIPIAPSGTSFQMIVWRALRDIPYGTTIGYGELARRLDRPRAARAVGAANGRNPISIVVPCHRVIGACGALVGYGWGLERKAALLELEAEGVARSRPRS